MTSKLTAFTEALTQVSNPSPAMRAYIEAVHTHAAHAADIEVPLDVWEASLEIPNRAWLALTEQERAQVNHLIGR